MTRFLWYKKLREFGQIRPYTRREFGRIGAIKTVMSGTTTATLETEEAEVGFLVRAKGAWTVRLVRDLDGPLREISPKRARGRDAVIDLTGLTRLDTAGAWLLHRTSEQLRIAGLRVSYRGETPEIRTLLDVAEGYRFEIDIDLGYAANTHQGSRSNPRFPVQQRLRQAAAQGA